MKGYDHHYNDEFKYFFQNGSCHHPLLESDAEYLINNPIEVMTNIMIMLIEMMKSKVKLCN